jgi:hypothetical protein
VSPEPECCSQEIHGPELYSSTLPHRYVGLLRKDGSVDRTVPLARLYGEPESIPEPERGNRPGFVIGALNGSVEAALEHNARLMAGPYAAMQHYGANKIDWEGPIRAAQEQAERDRPAKFRLLRGKSDRGETEGALVASERAPGEAGPVDEDAGPSRRKRERRTHVKGWIEQMEDVQWELNARERQSDKR